jgi:hypothetical protein
MTDTLGLFRILREAFRVRHCELANNPELSTNQCLLDCSQAHNNGHAGFIPDADEIIVIFLCLNYLSGLTMTDTLGLFRMQMKSTSSSFV